MAQIYKTAMQDAERAVLEKQLADAQAEIERLEGQRSAVVDDIGKLARKHIDAQELAENWQKTAETYKFRLERAQARAADFGAFVAAFDEAMNPPWSVEKQRRMVETRQALEKSHQNQP